MGSPSDNDRLAQLRNSISDLVQQYADITFAAKSFVPGETPVPVSGKVIGATELKMIEKLMLLSYDF